MFKLIVALAFCLLGVQAHGGYGNRWGGYGSRGMGRWGNHGGYGRRHGDGYGSRYGGRYNGGYRRPEDGYDGRYGGYGRRTGGHRYKRGVDEHDLVSHGPSLAMLTPEVKYDVHHVDLVPASNLHNAHEVSADHASVVNHPAANYALAGPVTSIL